MVTNQMLAATFCKMLQDNMSAEDFAACVAANKADATSPCCPSHDYLDTNQVMLEAMDAHGLTFDPSSDSCTNTINSVWTLARLHDYNA